jgi:hypothetical protein
MYRYPLFLSLFLILSCGEDDDLPIGPADQRQNSGFIVATQTPNQTAFARYFSELPNGEVDLSTGGTDYQRFFPVDGYEGALFLAAPDGGSGFAKVMVDGNGDIVREGFLSTVDATSFQIAVRDATTGVYHDRNTPDRITVFDPSDMSVSGTIDMSAGEVPVGMPQRYQTFYFRDNEVFAPVRANDGSFYDSLIVHVADVNTGSYLRTIAVGDAAGVPFNNYGQNDLAEDGTLYIPDQGNVNTAFPAGLHRILPGADDFDPDYDFQPAVALNPGNFFLPVFRGFAYVGDGLGIALVATDTPQAAIDIVQQAGGAQNLSDDQVQQILNILFTAENGRWCRLDLEARTVTPIDGIPAQSVFATTTFMRDGDLVYVPVTTETVNALYSYNPDTGTAAEVFSVTGGGALTGVYNLGRNN